MEHCKRVYSIPEGAKQAGIGRSKMYEEINDGKLHTFKIGKRHLIAAEDLDAYIQKCRNASVAA